MVKIKPRPQDYLKPFVLLVHVGDPGPDDPLLWHLVFEYDESYAWLLANGESLGRYPDAAEEAAAGHPPLFTAHLAALGLVAHQQVVRDLCPLCRYAWDLGVFGPSVPRWNIYRGQRGESLVPCICWDFLRDDPPPGFTWWGA